MTAKELKEKYPLYPEFKKERRAGKLKLTTLMRIYREGKYFLILTRFELFDDGRDLEKYQAFDDWAQRIKNEWEVSEEGTSFYPLEYIDNDQTHRYNALPKDN